MKRVCGIDGMNGMDGMDRMDGMNGLDGLSPNPKRHYVGEFNCQEENIITVFGIFAKYFKDGFRVTQSIKLKELLMALLLLLLSFPILIFG